MAEIDEILKQETREHLMSEMDEDSADFVIADMQECGFFDIEEDYPDEDYYYRWGR